MSEAEYRRLRETGGITTARPGRDEVAWTNPRTGEILRVDRGLDPSWAGSPGRDRPRLLAEMLARKIDDAGELTEALGREQVAQVLASPLLERQLAPMRKDDPPKGGLTAGWLESVLRPELGTAQRVIRLDQRGARHLRRRWGAKAAEIIRFVLPGLLLKPGLVLRIEDYRDRPGVSLAYFGIAEDARMFKAAVFQGAYPRLATLHDTDRGNAEHLIAQGAVPVLGSLEALPERE